MDRRGHIQIGMAALARGYLQLPGFADAMVDVGRKGGETEPADVWLEPGRLSAAQLQELLDPARGPTGATQDLATGGSPGKQPRAAEPIAHTLHSGAPEPPSSGPVSDLGDERYKVVSLLGSGGMGDVHKCTDATLQRPVALKVLHTELANDPTAARMLQREAQLTGSLEHPSIIPIYDMGARPDLGTYYVMRLVEQPSLADVLSRLRAGDADVVAEFTTGRLLRSFIQVCQAIDYAHNRGVVHCDIKPSNILLGSFGEVLVVDWGLARTIKSKDHYRGGTLGFMAPEQLGGGSGTVDARTDVFALGAVLYELLCIEQAFSEEALATMLKGFPAGAVPRRPIPSPRQRAPERMIPEELDAICMKALEPDPAARFPSARDLASAIEAFLEGTRAREHRRLRADELLREGNSLAEAYYELVQSRPERVEELRLLRSSIAPWEVSDRKRTLWDAEDRLSVLDHICLRTLQAARSAYELALDEVPGHPEARRALGRLYRAELDRAEDRRDDFDRVYFGDLVRQYDDALFAEAVRGEGALSVTSHPLGAFCTLATLEERDRRLIPVREEALGRTPVARVTLAPGRYLLKLRLDGSGEVKYPLLVRSGREVKIDIDLGPARDLAEGEVFVPGGPALLGGEGALDGELRQVDVPPFIIAARHVSFAEYLEFVGELFRTNRKLASKCVPCSATGFAFWRWDGRRFSPASLDLWGYREDTLLALPAFGVNARSAQAYAAWRSRREKRAFRLPTDEEWEKAARGTDGRRYPWGDHFDESFCTVRESRPGLPRPEPSGAAPFDTSPYGVLDMAGGMADWVVPDHWPPEAGGAMEIAEHVASRGGAWCDWSIDCRLSTRRPHLSLERSPRVGFRLVRSVPAADGAPA